MAIEGGVYQFTDSTHPEAGGRKPKKGEQAFQIKIPLEMGETLALNLGKGGMLVLMAWCCATIGDDAEAWDEIDAIADELVKDAEESPDGKTKT